MIFRWPSGGWWPPLKVKRPYCIICLKNLVVHYNPSKSFSRTNKARITQEVVDDRTHFDTLHRWKDLKKIDTPSFPQDTFHPGHALQLSAHCTQRISRILGSKESLDLAYLDSSRNIYIYISIYIHSSMMGVPRDRNQWYVSSFKDPSKVCDLLITCVLSYQTRFVLH